MSYSNTITVPHVDTPAMPRGAQAAGALYSALRTVFAPRTRRIPTRYEEAAAVRALAREMQDVDPSFAADLYAAACRHEG